MMSDQQNQKLGLRTYATFLGGVVLLLSAFIASAILNPVGLYGRSWFDPLFLPLVGLSFVLCLVSPFLSHIPVHARLIISLGALFVYGILFLGAIYLSLILTGWG